MGEGTKRVLRHFSKTVADGYNRLTNLVYVTLWHYMESVNTYDTAIVYWMVPIAWCLGVKVSVVLGFGSCVRSNCWSALLLLF